MRSSRLRSVSALAALVCLMNVCGWSTEQARSAEWVLTASVDDSLRAASQWAPFKMLREQAGVVCPARDLLTPCDGSLAVGTGFQFQQSADASGDISIRVELSAPAAIAGVYMQSAGDRLHDSARVRIALDGSQPEMSFETKIGTSDEQRFMFPSLITARKLTITLEKPAGNYQVAIKALRIEAGVLTASMDDSSHAASQWAPYKQLREQAGLVCPARDLLTPCDNSLPVGTGFNFGNANDVTLHVELSAPAAISGLYMQLAGDGMHDTRRMQVDFGAGQVYSFDVLASNASEQRFRFPTASTASKLYITLFKPAAGNYQVIIKYLRIEAGVLTALMDDNSHVANKWNPFKMLRDQAGVVCPARDLLTPCDNSLAVGTGFFYPKAAHVTLYAQLNEQATIAGLYMQSAGDTTHDSPRVLVSVDEGQVMWFDAQVGSAAEQHFIFPRPVSGRKVSIALQKPASDNPIIIKALRIDV